MVSQKGRFSGKPASGSRNATDHPETLGSDSTVPDLSITQGELFDPDSARGGLHSKVWAAREGRRLAKLARRSSQGTRAQSSPKVPPPPTSS